MASEVPPVHTAEAPFHVLTKPNGPACNLGCEYCFYLEKAQLYPEGSTFEMAEDTLETFIRQYIEGQPGPVVSFAWQGGEPTLLGVEFFRKVVEFQEQHTPENMWVENAIQTNGTLLDDEWCEFLAENEFLVGISIDGPPELHNRYRKTRTDGSTFETVKNGLDQLQTHDVDHNVLCVVNAVNSHHPEEVYSFFKSQGVQWLQFIPLVEPLDIQRDDEHPDLSSPEVQAQEETDKDDCEWVQSMPTWVRDCGGCVTEHDEQFSEVVTAARSAEVSVRSVDSVDYGNFMRTIFDEWVRNDMGEVSIRLFDQCLERVFHHRASLCVFDETCGSQVAIEHNGDLYACDHFVDPGFKRGNIHDTHVVELIESPEQQQFGKYKRDGLPERCNTCNVREFCHGGCPKNWELITPAGEGGLNHLCAGYRLLFTYVQPYLDLIEEKVASGLPIPYAMDAVHTYDSK